MHAQGAVLMGAEQMGMAACPALVAQQAHSISSG